MGLFDIFKKKEAEGFKKIPIAEIVSWLGEFSEEVRKADERRLQISKKVFDSLPQIKKSIECLRDSKANEIKRLEGIINSLKDSYVKRSMVLYSKFPSDFIQQDFIQRVDSVLDEMNNPNPKEIYAVSSYFQEDSKPLVDSIKNTQAIISEYMNFMSSGGKIIGQKQSIESLIADREKFASSTDKLNNEIEDEKFKISSTEVKISELEKDIEKIKASEKIDEKFRLESELNSLNNHLSSLEASIRDGLSPLKKPLRKFEHLVSLSKEESALALSFSKSPFKTFMESTNSIKSLVSKTQESNIDLKGKDKEKLESFDIEKLLQMKKDFLEKTATANDISSRISLIDISKDIELVKTKIDALMKEIENRKKDISSKKGSLEKLSGLSAATLSKIKENCLELGVEIAL